MDAIIVEQPAFRLVGHAVRLPLKHNGINPHVQSYNAAVSEAERARLRRIGNTEPTGLLQVSDDVDPYYVEGSEFIHLYGVSIDGLTPVPANLHVIEAPAGKWAVFSAPGPSPLTWDTVAREWFLENPWQIRPGPEIAANYHPDENDATSTSYLWIPVERAGCRREPLHHGLSGR